MKKIFLVFPTYKQTPVQAIGEYLHSLPEFQLLNNLELLPVAWQESDAGASTDWIQTIFEMQQKWHQAEGFIVWLPPAAILPVAGSLKLMAKQAGKPIVLFASGDPKTFENKSFSKLHLSSHLINAYYAAQSDIGEVIVLNEDKLFRPDNCEWRGSEVLSISDPLATLHFGIDIHADYYERNKAKLPEPDFKPFANDILMMKWFPHAQSPNIENASAVFVNTDVSYLNDKNLNKVREKAQEKGVPIIWHSSQDWGKQKFEKGELGVTHPLAWWAALVTQFSFGQFGKDKALKQIKQLVV